MDLVKNEIPSSDDFELNFLILKFLRKGTCPEAARLLEEELNKQSRGLLPPRLDWEGNPHQQKIHELERQYPHVGTDHLAILFSRLRLCLGVSNNSSLLSNPLPRRPSPRIWQPPGIVSHHQVTGFQHSLSVYTIMYKRLRLLRRNLGHRSSVFCLLFDKTGQYVFTGADDRIVKMWSIRTGRLYFTFKGATSEISDMAVSEDNQMLAAGSTDKIIRVWCLLSAAPVAVLTKHTGTITALHFCPAAVPGVPPYLAATSGDGAVSFWKFSYKDKSRNRAIFDLEPTRYLDETRTGNCQMICANFSPCGLFLATGSADHHIRLFKMDGKEGPVKVLEEEAHTERVDSIQWGNSPLLRFISGSKDGTARLWSYRTGQWSNVELRMTAEDGRTVHYNRDKNVEEALRVTMVSWNSNDTKVITAVSDSTLCVWDPVTAVMITRLKGHKGEVFVLEPHPSRQEILLSGGHDGNVIIWDITTNEMLFQHYNIDGQDFGAILDAKWSPDNLNIAASDSHGHVLFFGMTSKQPYEAYPVENFFNTDYSTLLHNSSYHVVDEKTQCAPRLLKPPLLVDIEGNPYPAGIQKLVPGREHLSDQEAILPTLPDLDQESNQEDDTLLSAQENLPKDEFNRHQSTDIQKNSPSHGESCKSLDGNENNEPPSASSSSDVSSVSHLLSESYRNEIVEITKEINTLVEQCKDEKNTGLITFSYEHFAKGRVKVVGHKIVSGQMLKTGKHLGLSKEQAELKVVKEMLQLLEAKFSLQRNCPDESIEKFCKAANLGDPKFQPSLMEGNHTSHEILKETPQNHTSLQILRGTPQNHTVLTSSRKDVSDKRVARIKHSGGTEALVDKTITNELKNKNCNEFDDNLIIIEDGESSTSNSNDNKSKLEESIKLCEFPIDQPGAVIIAMQDYATLDSGTFVNDMIIDFYIKFLEHKVLPSGDQGSVQIFSTMFYKRLLQSPKISKNLAFYETDSTLTLDEKRHYRVAGWTKNIDLFSMKMIIVPICQNSHWFLLILVNPGALVDAADSAAPCIIVLDSMGGDQTSAVNNLRGYLKWEWKKRKCGGRDPVEEIKISSKELPAIYPEKPEQDNGIDCGIFLLHYVEKIFQNVTQFLSINLLELDLSKWFTMQEVGQKRARIAELIRQLAKEQNSHKIINYPNIKIRSNEKPLVIVTNDNDNVVKPKNTIPAEFKELSAKGFYSHHKRVSNVKQNIKKVTNKPLSSRVKQENPTHLSFDKILEEKLKPKKKKKKASDLFDYSDDPDVIDIIKQEKAAAKKVTSNAKKGSKFAKGVQKITNFSRRIGLRKRKKNPDYCDDKQFESPPKRQRNNDEAPSPSLSQDSPDSIPMSPSLMISPIQPRKLASWEEDEIEDDVANDTNEYVPDLDELLKRPERPADGSKSKEEMLDKLDRQIAERQQIHEEEMARVEADIEGENLKRSQRKLRRKENAKLRNRLQTELTETRLRSMFEANIEYLRDVWSGKVESSRHQAFHKSIQTRHAIYYTIITDPFTDFQLDWTLDEIGKVWMSNRRDYLDNKEYVWKVLLPECFIKFYMDFFNFSKNEAMTRISETPLHKKDRLKEFMTKSDEEEESEED